MKKQNLLFTIVLVLLVGGSAGAESSLHDLSPKSQSLQGVSYPRNGWVQYRGTSDQQMNVHLAIRAMLGDSSVHVESLLFSTIKNKLMDRSFSAAVPLSRYLENEIENRKRNGPLSEAEAAKATRSLVDGTLAYSLKENSIVPRYVDYQSSSFVDWPQDIVFTTLVSPAAATYGNRVLVIQEKTPRSLDLNYWNYVQNKTWYYHTRDASEFITYGYVLGSDIIGYQIRTGGNKSWHRIQTALYASKDGSQDVILVFSGKRKNQSSSTCMMQDPATKKVQHCQYRAGEIALTPPPIDNETAQLHGALIRCAVKENCKLKNKGIFTAYERAPLDGLNIQDLEFTQDGNSYVFIPYP